MSKKPVKPKRGEDTRIKSGRYVVHSDFESRPSVRLIHKGRMNPETWRIRNPVRQAALAVLGIVQSNIRSNLEGRWTPIQYGPRKGSKALQGTEDDWTVRRISTQHYRVQPRREFQKRWRGHIAGTYIYPKNRRSLKFLSYDGIILYKPFVKMPKRDPRPTVTQLRRMSNGLHHGSI